MRGAATAITAMMSSDDSSMFRRCPLGPVGSRVLVTLEIGEVARC